MDEELVNPFNPENDIFGSLKDYQPEVIKDEPSFKTFKGRYTARILKITHNIGVSTTTSNPYDFYSLRLQVTETIEGDKADKRLLDKRYQNTPEGMKKLMNDLFTMGVEYGKENREAFDLSLSSAVDKIVNVRAWTWTPDKTMDGAVIPEDERVAKQQFTVVKDFSKTKKSTTSEKAPF